MKTLKYLSLLLLVTLVLMISGCKKKAEKPAGPEPTKFEQAMTAKDTLAVKNLIDKFFTFVKEKKYGDAAAMLCRNDTTKQHVPEPLDNKEMQKVREMLESVPMVDYEIEYIKFDKYYANEVLCNVIIKEAEGDMPAIKTKMFFKPVDCADGWALCVMNTEYGDKGVVNPYKRDSVRKAYEEKERKKAGK